MTAQPTQTPVSLTPSSLTDSENLLPAANVHQIMARELPEGCTISNDAMSLMQELATEFIGFITSEANDMALSEGRSITSLDLADACTELDLGQFAQAVHTHNPTPYTNNLSSDQAAVQAGFGEGVYTSHLHSTAPASDTSN